MAGVIFWHSADFLVCFLRRPLQVVLENQEAVSFFPAHLKKRVENLLADIPGGTSVRLSWLILPENR